MNELFGINLKNYLLSAGINDQWGGVLQFIIAVVVIFVLAWLSDTVTKKILITVITKIIRKTKTQWDDILLKHNFFNKISHFVPALIIFYSAEMLEHPVLEHIVQSGLKIYMIVLLLIIINSLLNISNDIYITMPISRNRPIKGYMQIVKIFFYAIGIIIVIAIVFNKSPWNLIAGMSAFVAVLILVFKDTILGFIASIQLSANKMVSIGDWITMQSHNADGTVIDISLNTVKVQNWDKTISTIPTYALVADSFSNWKGMEESGGRRIKRHLSIDMKSIHFLSEEEIDRFEKIKLIKDHIRKMRAEIERLNPKGEIPINQRRLTNVGAFRKYVEAYLKEHPKIHNEMTFLIRQLQPSEKGLPLEIYVFSNDQEWGNYEAIQADVFDHILAVIPEFDLRVFQNPTGDDFKRLAERS